MGKKRKMQRGIDRYIYIYIIVTNKKELIHLLLLTNKQTNMATIAVAPAPIAGNPMVQMKINMNGLKAMIKYHTRQA